MDQKNVPLGLIYSIYGGRGAATGQWNQPEAAETGRLVW